MHQFGAGAGTGSIADLASGLRRIDFDAHCVIFSLNRFNQGRLDANSCNRHRLPLPAHAFRLRQYRKGLKKDGQEASHAMDNASHRVLSAGAKK